MPSPESPMALRRLCKRMKMAAYRILVCEQAPTLRGFPRPLDSGFRRSDQFAGRRGALGWERAPALRGSPIGLTPHVGVRGKRTREGR